MKKDKGIPRAKFAAGLVLVFVLFPALYVSGQAKKIGDRTAPFFRILSSGTYHMKASDGDTEMELYCKGDMTSVAMIAEGESLRMVSTGKKTYMIFDTSKMVLIGPSDANQESMKLEFDKMTFVRSGTAVFKGKSLPYDEYLDKDGDKSQFFVDGNKLAGIRSIDGKGEQSDMVISALDQNVPNSVFEIPAGYQVQDMSN